MNQTQTRSLRKKVLSLILAVVMVVSLLPISAFASGDSKASTAASTDEFVRIFHLDCGRKYFSVSEIEGIIDQLAENHYTHLELAFGNNGLRFLLDKMPVGTYTSDQVKTALTQGNATYSQNNGTANTMLSQTDMDAIISYAKGKDISIIPLMNAPGHMDAVIYAMQNLGMSGVSYNQSTTTIDVTNSAVVDFTKELLQLYVDYFAGKGCEYFNMGADEYANDIYKTGDMGFGQLINAKQYGQFAEYVNSIAAIIENAKMTPMAFNDGIYYDETTVNDNKQVTFDKNIVICYWTSGYWNQTKKYSPASASFLAKNHKIISTNDAWYYVLGRADGTYGLSNTRNNVQTTKVTSIPGDNNATTPIGAMMCLWCDDPSAGYSTAEQSNVKYLIQTLAASNPTYFTKSTTTDPGTDTGEEKTIEISVGETKTVTINGANYENDHTTPDTAIATVTVKGQNEVPGTVDYTKASATYNTLAGNYSAWGQTGYYYKNGDNYYPVYAYAESKQGLLWSTTTYYVGYLVPGSSEVKQLASSTRGWDSVYNLYRRESETEVTPASTTVRFTGVAVGTTYVTVGNVKYTINVVDKAPSNAMTDTSITLQYWITNFEVYETQSKTGHTETITTSTKGATTDEGIAIAGIAPNHAYSFFDGTKDVYYWQAMRLDKDNQQTNASGDDETADGKTLTHIRYYGGAWQYKTVDGTWHYFVSTDQLVAYYLQKVASTKEVTTYVKDWGFSTTNENTNDNTTGGQVALTIAVVYPDGSISPAEGDMYQNSTTILNYWEEGRDIGIVAPINNSDYNISKITVTDGARTARKDSKDTRYYWYKDDSITWQKKTLASGGEWYDETTVWDKSKGTTPMVNGKSNDVKWTAKNTAKLVLIYLEPIVKDSNLNVVYQDDNTNTEISRYQIVMSYNQGQDQPTFDTSLKNSSGAVIGTTKNWPGKESSEQGYLPDDAYVTNSSQKDQKIDKNLATITGISGIYASGLYEYVGADISEDGKTLTLHYNLKNTSNKTFVMDFGLPLQIPTSEFGITNFESTVETVSFDQDKVTHERDGKYGHGSIDVDRGIVTYTLTKALDQKIPIPVYVTFKNDKNVHVYNVYVIPATSVYYEDSFATFNPGAGAATDAKWSIVGNDGQETTDQSKAVNQALSALGAKDIYGYDKAYKDSTKLSMGSAHKVTVSADMAKTWTPTSQWPTATFTFKGTGFDVISLTDNTSGAIFVDVYKGTATSGDSVKSYAVNNYYSYKQNENGQWDVSKDGNNALYQIPVMKVSGLDYGEYTAVIRVAYSSFFDQTTKNEYNFWLDAIRVYDPMGKDNATYGQDNEGYPQYIKLRDSLVGGTATAKAGSVFIDGADKATIDQYKNGGPNNEVYLAYGQAISFTVAENKDIATIQIGAKAPNGTANMTVNNTEAVNGGISTATEMYYKLDVQPGQQVTISNTGGGILSLTNLKITFNSKPNTTVTLAALSDEDQANAVAQVRALFAAPAEPFNPDRFDASWSRNVRKGETAKLTVKTSEDVEAITVNGETIDSFTERHERTGWGWWAKTVTYREFIYTTTADVTRDYTVCAVNAAGVRSEEKTATLTVRPSVRDWLHGIFGKWF